MNDHYDFCKGKRGAAIPTPPGKERITIRLDADILDYFSRSSRRGRRRQLPDGDVVRRVIRQELRKASQTFSLVRTVRAVRTQGC